MLWDLVGPEAQILIMCVSVCQSGKPHPRVPMLRQYPYYPSWYGTISFNRDDGETELIGDVVVGNHTKN
jgi:hypothetical protein